MQNPERSPFQFFNAMRLSPPLFGFVRLFFEIFLKFFKVFKVSKQKFPSVIQRQWWAHSLCGKLWIYHRHSQKQEVLWICSGASLSKTPTSPKHKNRYLPAKVLTKQINYKTQNTLHNSSKLAKILTGSMSNRYPSHCDSFKGSRNTWNMQPHFIPIQIFAYFYIQWKQTLDLFRKPFHNFLAVEFVINAVWFCNFSVFHSFIPAIDILELLARSLQFPANLGNLDKILHSRTSRDH